MHRCLAAKSVSYVSPTNENKALLSLPLTDTNDAENAGSNSDVEVENSTCSTPATLLQDPDEENRAELPSGMDKFSL